jgi:hypothetical protein
VTTNGVLHRRPIAFPALRTAFDVRERKRHRPARKRRI